jgi:CHAD domain-containing protein
MDRTGGPVSPEEAMGRAAQATLEQEFRKLRKKLEGARRGDPESVHDARTLIRRLRVGLGIMGRTAFEPACTGRLERALQGVEHALGPTRDDDVFLAHLDRWAARAAAHDRADVAPLRRRMVARRKRNARRVAQDLDRKPARQAIRRLRAFLADPSAAALEPPGNPAKSEPALVRHFIHDVTWRAYEEVLAYDTRESFDVGAVHKFRSACRRLRFTLDFFDGATADAATVVEPLYALQTRLGELHDHALAAQRIERWLARGRVPKTPGVLAYLAARAHSRDLLLAEFDAERRAMLAGSFRVALFHVITGARIRTKAGYGGLRLVPAA